MINISSNFKNSFGIGKLNFGSDFENKIFLAHSTNGTVKIKKLTKPMKRLLLICILILTNTAFGQSLNSLDIKNGFRNFKFGTSPAQIKNIVKESRQSSKNPYVVDYNYIGNDIKNVFNVKVDKVTLSFFKNKLFNITASFGNLENLEDFELYEYNSILFALERTYGTRWVKSSNADGDILNGAIWDASNVRFELIRFDFSKSYTNPRDYGYISGYINVFDKKLSDEMYASDF